MYVSHLVPSAGGAALPPLGLSSQALTLESLFATQPVDKFAAGEGVFWEGDAASDLFQIAEGCLRLYHILPDGRRAIIGLQVRRRDARVLLPEAFTVIAPRPSPPCGCAGSVVPAFKPR